MLDDELDEDDQGLWDDIENGKRGPVQIIYVASSKELADIDLDSIIQWGELTGQWDIHLVASCEEAIHLNRAVSADVIILLNLWVEEAHQVAKHCPHTPLCIAAPSGFNQFDFTPFPPQVIVAQWAAPREHEFQDGISEALSKVATRIIYEANLPRIEVIKAVSRELLDRLADFPEHRFGINPRLFEETVAELLARMGYEVRLTPHSGDGGRDVIAVLKTPVAPVLMLVECKRYARHRLVGPEPITRLWSRMFDDHSNIAMVVTTSGFQPVAKETARSRGYQVTLKEGDDFIDWVRSLR